MRALALSLLILILAAELRAQIPPDAPWRVLETTHFRVTFPPELDPLARRAADRAEAAHARLAAELAAAPGGRIDILLTDYVDISNGYATPIPSNRIVLYARPPVDMLSLAYLDDWIDEVVAHELTHIFHLDATGWLGRGVRTLFGRVPAPWPVFPAAGTPSWSIEGLATYVESRFTGAGRVHGTYHDMVLRTAVLEGAFETIDRMSGTSPAWPAGARSYIYGSLFADYLARRYGPEVHRDLVRATARAWVPPPLAFDRIARRTIGQSFSDAYDDWRRELDDRYRRLADSLAAEGLTAPERLGTGGYYAVHPRVGPGGRIAYAALDGRSVAATRVLDPATGRARDIARRNGLGPLAWLPDGSILTAQIEFHGPYRIYSDLYRIERRGERRLTRGQRLSEPDVAGDGRRVVAVQAVGGTNRLVVYDLDSGGMRALTGARPDVHWAFPRWAPDGTRIAVGRWRAGARYDVVVLDTLGTLLHELTDDRAVDLAPAWSPDGRWIVFSSDRSGIANLYAYDLGPRAAAAAGVPATTLRQVTNLLTGAFFPDVSPDGRWIVFSAYHADGFHLERIPFDPSAWREPAPLRADQAEQRADQGGAGAAASAGPVIATTGVAGTGADSLSAAGMSAVADTAPHAGAAAVPSRTYSAWPTLLPRAWLPVVYGNDQTGTFLGATIRGEDLVGRHAYTAATAYQAADGLFGADLAYAFAGLGNPVLGIRAFRDWDDLYLPTRPPGAPDARLLSREDVAGLSASLVRRRIRSSAVLSAGIERGRERRLLLDAPGYRPSYPGFDFAGAFGRIAYADYRAQPYSISREDGVSISLDGRRRRDLGPFSQPGGSVIDRSYDEATLQAHAYKAIRLPGFAHHVLAGRVGGRRRTGPGAEPFGIGGASGIPYDVVVDRIGGPYRLLPVRGFHEDDRWGTRGWSASLEYRFPLIFLNRGASLRPVFLDRLSGTAFLDAGDAWCTDDERRPGRFEACPAPAAAPIVAAGAELGLDLTLFFSAPLRLRTGLGVPVQGPRTSPSLYVRIGHSF